ncbi:MAG: phosphatidate cytidylyltransferase [Treponema sp.]|nr:phosphatidate cytidylyltransferase [Treponema sp.]
MSSIKKIIPRLGIFFIGLPLLLAVILFPWGNHLPLHILIVTVSALATSEAYDMFLTKTKLQPKWFIILLNIFITVVASLTKLFPIIFGREFPVGEEIISYTFISTMLIILMVEVFFADSFENSLGKISASVFILLYTAYLITFVSRMTTFSKGGKDVSSQLIAEFLLMVCFCDSFAWFFGVLFGKNNKGFIKASPNKSIAGFMGGIAGSIGAGILGFYLWPDIFTGSILKIIFTGFIMALTSIVGDLTESVMKRSAGFKNSGNIIPGRGGILDSMDSILMSAPLYYMLISIFYGPL